MYNKEAALVGPLGPGIGHVDWMGQAFGVGWGGGGGGVVY
jgi:hypothetical protein